MKHSISVNKDSGTTFKLTPAPLPFRVFNWLETILEKQGKSLINLSESSLLEAAIKKTGLSDWGNQDFLIPLRILLQSCIEDAKLTLFGKYTFRYEIIELLKNRLCIQDELKRHPEILKEKIRKPLFVVGFPRTGTTLLHNLLSQDPSARYLRGWETRRPSLHSNFLAREPDPRIRWREQDIQSINRYLPEILLAHPQSSEGPEECHYLLTHSFNWETTLGMLFNLPQFGNWLKHQDRTPAYQYYYQILQLLQWHSAGDHWTLKSPDHLGHIELLLKFFPDARIVMVHRDPLKVIPSVCSLTAIGRGINSKHVDLESLGRELTIELIGCLEHVTHVRRSYGSDHFYDVLYSDLIDDPKGTIEKIYKNLGYNYVDQLGTHIDKWLIEDRQNKKGKKRHSYSLKQFNLDSDKITHQFRDYYKQFEIPHE